MKVSYGFILFAIIMLSACSGENSNSDKPVVGSDRDDHGCIPSAGYLWCPATNRCERPWELADQQGFENTSQAFEKFCNSGERKSL